MQIINFTSLLNKVVIFLTSKIKLSTIQVEKKFCKNEKKLKKYAKTFDKAGGGDILNGEKQNASFALKLWLSTIL